MTDLSALLNIYQGKICKEHLDFNNHVNVMWYTHFFDMATRELFEFLGCGESYVKAENKSMFALEQHTRYLRELHLDDEFCVCARILGCSEKRIHFMLFLQHEEQGFVSATGEFVGMHVNLGKRGSEPFPEDVARAITDQLNQHQTLQWDPPLCDKMSA